MVIVGGKGTYIVMEVGDATHDQERRFSSACFHSPSRFLRPYHIGETQPCASHAVLPWTWIDSPKCINHPQNATLPGNIHSSHSPALQSLYCLCILNTYQASTTPLSPSAIVEPHQMIGVPRR